MQQHAYEAKKKRVIEQFRSLQGAGQLALNKQTSNLFRERTAAPQKLHTRDFNQVISIDTKAQTMTVEGMTTFEKLTDVALEHGLVPFVVPELKTITIGGAVSGMAIESSSFAYGLVQESVLSMEVLVGTGEVLTCSPTQHRDLFYGLPNSYGTLGYILQLTIQLRPAKAFVRLEHLRFDNDQEYFAALQTICITKTYKDQTVDFVDGSIFSSSELYITLGFETDTAPYTSDYTFQKQYFRSIQTRSIDYLTMHDYLWRWDTDWFWCSKNVFADRKLVRWLLGRHHLGSRSFSQIMQFEQRHKFYERFLRLIGQYQPREDVIQDIEVPIDKASEFLKAFQETVGISPIWVCPTKTTHKKWPYTLYPMDPAKLYVNFGFWDSVPAKGDPKDAYYNKFVEKLVFTLGGMKSLYSSSYYERAQFEQLYNYPAYTELKKQYDPNQRFRGLYEKCVLKQ